MSVEFLFHHEMLVVGVIVVVILRIKRSTVSSFSVVILWGVRGATLFLDGLGNSTGMGVLVILWMTWWSSRHVGGIGSAGQEWSGHKGRSTWREWWGGSSGMVVWIGWPLSWVMMCLEATRIAGLGVTIVFLIFVFVSAVSIWVVLLLFVGAKGLYRFCNH